MKHLRYLLLLTLFAPNLFGQISLETNFSYAYQINPFIPNFGDLNKSIFNKVNFEVGIDFDKKFVTNKFAWNYSHVQIENFFLDFDYANSTKILKKSTYTTQHFYNLSYTLLTKPFRINNVGISPFFNLNIAYLELGKSKTQSTIISDTIEQTTFSETAFGEKELNLGIGYGLRLSYFTSEKSELFFDLNHQNTFGGFNRQELFLKLGFKYHLKKNMSELISSGTQNFVEKRGLEFQFNSSPINFSNGLFYVQKMETNPASIQLSEFDPNVNALYYKISNPAENENSFANFGFSASMNYIKNRMVYNFGLNYNSVDINYSSISYYQAKYVQFEQKEYFDFHYQETNKLKFSVQSVGLLSSIGVQFLDPSAKFNICPTFTILLQHHNYDFQKDENYSVINYNSYFPNEPEVKHFEEQTAKASDKLNFNKQGVFESFLGLHFSYNLNSSNQFKLKYNLRISDNEILKEQSLRLVQKHNFSIGFVKSF